MSKLILKYATGTGVKGPEGFELFNKYQTIGEVRAGKTKAGKNFSVVEDSAGNQYYISPVKEKKGPRSPSMVLTVKEKDAQESSVLCGLFPKEREGIKTLQGKNKESNVKYGIFPESSEGGRRELAPATAADLGL